MSNQLFFLSLADIFSVYPKIFKEISAARNKPKHVYLPSDAEWQDKVYYRLLDVQKRVNEAIETGVELEDLTGRKDKPVFDHLHDVKRFSPSPANTPNGLRFENRKKCCKTKVKVTSKLSACWSLENISKAAQLLKKPPLSVTFENEHEMRKVYSLIYDVFRYKVVMASALADISFYEQYPQHINDQNRVWLMLFELFDREFKTRNSEEIAIQMQLYTKAEVADIAEHLWNFRKRLAASISRMRIKRKALSLSQLLPIHLQNEKVAIAASNPIVTGWVNPFLLRNKSNTDKCMANLGFIEQANDDSQPILMSKRYKWDNVCPLFISCIPEDRGEFTKSKLMTKHSFIMQDRTFSYGPAVMSRLLDFFELDGDILQTHISSPRSTAYLASLFYSVNRVNNFYVYGAGSNLKEYRKYMEKLGVTNIRIFSESFTSFPLESKRFGTVVGIFANPPNSFSAISDPIDLICSRGGDLSMLEVLTESEISDDGKHRVALILEEQLLTLQMAMSRPQIQFVLYQTHSMVNTENLDMVKHAIELINATSLKKHRAAFRERKRLEALAELEAANIPSAAMNTGSPRKRNAPGDEKTKSDAAAAEIEAEKTARADTEENVILPEIDEFIYDNIPDICINQDNCVRAQSTGCFVSLIRRKSITCLNAKYLIEMAEARGLFGKAETNKSARGRNVKTQEANMENSAQDNAENKPRQSKHVNIDNVLARLMQATIASSIRSNVDKFSTKPIPIIFNFKRRQCFRFLHPSILKFSSTSQRMKFWWNYAFRACIREISLTKRQWPPLDFRHDCTIKLKLRRKGTIRQKQLFPVHINEIKILCNVRAYK